MYVVLASYLRHLEDMERAKPESERIEVPSMKELAELAGISPVTLSRISTGKIRSLNLETATTILDELNRRGFNAGIEHLIVYRKPGA